MTKTELLEHFDDTILNFKHMNAKYLNKPKIIMTLESLKSEVRKMDSDNVGNSTSKVGHWKFNNNGQIVCSVCNSVAKNSQLVYLIDLTPHCAICGARTIISSEVKQAKRSN